MRRLARLGCFAAVAALSWPSMADAQRPGELTLFSDVGFRGQSYTVTGPREHINLDWPVRSARVTPGDTWQLCSSSRYRGICSNVSRSTGNVLWTVASGRPMLAARPMPLPPGGGAPGAPDVGGSLRGMSAEFFPAPAERSVRVNSCEAGTAACTADSANAFCRAHGWTRSAYQRQETVAGKNYLADVLCVRA
ncbi:MAG TPA: hypothetical protein VGH86_04640 [Phenylobacterium sp.]